VLQTQSAENNNSVLWYVTASRTRAVHHECIFHALREVREHAKEACGTNYAETCPEEERWLKEIDAIFDARTKRTAQRRYEHVLAQREHFEGGNPAARAISDFPERHWDHLVNAVESRRGLALQWPATAFQELVPNA
jgi:hypothetical protein